jgi:hypothetical protein
MKVTLESTAKTVHLNGIPARVWEGHTESGIPAHAFITRIACDLDADAAEFERDLNDCRPPSAEIAAYPARLVL